MICCVRKKQLLPARAYLNCRPIDRGKVLSAIAELHLSARLDRELLERTNVLNEQIHETQLVDEPDENVQAGRVEGD